MFGIDDILSAGASFIGSSASALVNDSLQKGRTEWNKEQDLDKMRKAPTAQMQGLAAAGLNPMLAYGKLDFGGVAPGPMGNTNFVGDFASARQSQAALDSAEAAGVSSAASSRLADASVSKIGQEIENLKTDNEKAKVLIDNLVKEGQNLVKQGWNLTEVGNHLRSMIAKLAAEVPWVRSQQALAEANRALTEVQTGLSSLDLSAANKLDNFGREVRQLQPVFDLIRSILRPR